MTLESKKEHILRLIKLGMELYRAELITECTEEEIDNIEKDEKFNRKAEIYDAISEKELLDKLEKAIDIAVDKGKSSAIQWKLERLNPGRWGNKEAEKRNIDLKNLSISLVGKDTNDKND